MFLIKCPWCGPRDQREFSCHGEAHRDRPTDPYAIDDTAWADYLFMQRNSRGIHFERWTHRYGCRRWFNVARDTVTDKILAIYKMGSPPPEHP